MANRGEAYLRALGERVVVFDGAMGTSLQAQELIGIFHSHVSSPAYPSATDVRLAFYPEAVYFLVSLARERERELRGYTIVDGNIEEVEVVVEP